MSLNALIDNLPDLPVKEVLPTLLATLDEHNRVVLEAPPGAGKTTLVPLALLHAGWRQNGKIIMLEPRRLAARAAAHRMADLLGQVVGQTVGYRVRLERAVSEATQIEVVTEGILTRLLQDDPALEGVGTIIFDEFHERSLQADVGLALALDAQQVLRPDLRLLVMSATLDAAAVGNWLGGPVVQSAGRMYPVETLYALPTEVAAAGNRMAERLKMLVPKAIRKALNAQEAGDLLVFLPGIGEMRAIEQLLHDKLPPHIDVHLLHGELSLAQQQAAIKPAPAGRRKIVLATSIAETSLTIEGISVVIDGGYARVPQFIPRSGLTTLITTPVSQAAADQRRGRAGRLGPGTCYRLWTAAEQLLLPPRQAPEILEADLSALMLELAIWGVKDPLALKWLDNPPPAAVNLARELLYRLEAIDLEHKPTRHGKDLAQLGLPPRLGHLVRRGHELGYGPTACALAALLAEKDILKPVLDNRESLWPDLTVRLELFAGKKPATPGYLIDENRLKRIREQARHLRQRLREPQEPVRPAAAGLLTGLAYPDRLAQKEASGRLRLITGQRVQLATELFSEAEFYAIAQLDHKTHPRVLLAAPVAKSEILENFSQQIITQAQISWDGIKERVITRQVKTLGALLLEESNLPNPDAESVTAVLLQAVRDKGLNRLPWSEEAQLTRQRLNFLHHLEPNVWPDGSEEALTATLAHWLKPHLTGLRSLEQVARLNLNQILLAEFSWDKLHAMDRLAPTHLPVPSGSRIALNYAVKEAPVLAVRLQEIFGLLDTPRIADGRVPLLIHLLSPAGRPVQVTRDLRSFWATGYFEVRKDLRGRYPKHYWPEDPLAAIPTRGTKKKPL